MHDVYFTFIRHYKKVESILGELVFNWMCGFCGSYSLKVKTERRNILMNIAKPLHQNMQRIATSEDKDQDWDVPLSAFSLYTETRDSYLTIIRPHIIPWLKRDQSPEHVAEWMDVLENLTLASDNIKPSPQRAHGLFAIFPDILDLITTKFAGEKITENFTPKEEDSSEESEESKLYKLYTQSGDNDTPEVSSVLGFFANLCCDKEQAMFVYARIEPYLEEWFEVFKKKECEEGLKQWTKLISTFVRMHELTAAITPKYDTEMRWASWNGGWAEYCKEYFEFVEKHREEESSPEVPQSVLDKLVSIEDLQIYRNEALKATTEARKSELYHELKPKLEMVFETILPKHMPLHDILIVLCCQCMSCLTTRYLFSVDDMADLCSMFLDPMIKAEAVFRDSNDLLSKEVSRSIYTVSECYSAQSECRKPQLLSVLDDSLIYILSEGEKVLLDEYLATNILETINNLSLLSPTHTCDILVDIIKPHVLPWLAKYDTDECIGKWMTTLSRITYDTGLFAPSYKRCQKLWFLFHPVLKIVRRELDEAEEEAKRRRSTDQSNSTDGGYTVPPAVNVLGFFANLCCNYKHAIEIHKNIKNLLDEWYESFKLKGCEWALQPWSLLVAELSNVAALLPSISPQYDDEMRWIHEFGKTQDFWDDGYEKYIENIKNGGRPEAEHPLLEGEEDEDAIPPQRKGKGPGGKKRRKKGRHGVGEGSEDSEFVSSYSDELYSEPLSGEYDQEEFEEEEEESLTPELEAPRVISPRSMSRRRRKGLFGSGKRKRKLTSADKDPLSIGPSTRVEPLCILGCGSFGENLLVSVEGMRNPCVFKKMFKVGSKSVTKRCRKEFKSLKRLYSESSCLHHIPEPISILNFLDERYDGIYGFVSEFCLGGNLRHFASKWCVAKVGSLSSSSPKSPLHRQVMDEEDEYSESSDSADDLGTCGLDGIRFDPLRVASVCVAIIECVADICDARPDYVHKAIKLENFLVRCGKHGSCSLVLSDVGLPDVQEYIMHRLLPISKSEKQGVRKEKQRNDVRKAMIDTLSYNAPESLQRAIFSQKSDGWGVALCCWSLFNSLKRPYAGHIFLRDLTASEMRRELLVLATDDVSVPDLRDCELFVSLKRMSDGRYRSVFQTLAKVFLGLTEIKPKQRITLQQARQDVQSIKKLLPAFGKGFKPLSIKQVISKQLDRYDGDCGTIVGMDL
ncbi:hypothetical protein ADUPG1_013952 [Aduncisulcus paluster]|uniref:Protein kinase domain-containing protein n=1 Tax=Aduncisulcus paluster TaxID=2918883 RepID=A0ABQ5K6U1_9EUKA|nr:hypothetical protein ADUPG1_013952 [Aduncisulcus paluster]|eukprot:gnl/Carplike_NY0171/3535_a4773_205.p1 GENE.gnl/Carplike_NY0171/3535_a4773_205~~gnl/Carplike_NY0171/3535_a4773_205.p1  ORF type:complete len:1234 (+),score=331.07 gnl/Carplike_NY0171/3535_a4773_205:121-3702(+)